jgi:hypothetical protein
MTAEAPYPPPAPPLIYYIYWFSLHEVAPYPVAVICPVAVPCCCTTLLYLVAVLWCRALAVVLWWWMSHPKNGDRLPSICPEKW